MEAVKLLARPAIALPFVLAIAVFLSEEQYTSTAALALGVGFILLPPDSHWSYRYKWVFVIIFVLVSIWFFEV